MNSFFGYYATGSFVKEIITHKRRCRCNQIAPSGNPSNEKFGVKENSPVSSFPGSIANHCLGSKRCRNDMDGTTTAPSIADLLCYQQKAYRVPLMIQTMHGSGWPGKLNFLAVPSSVVSTFTKPGGSVVSWLIGWPFIFGHTKAFCSPSSFIQMTNIPLLLF